jgi:hypothetical protein
MGAVSVATRGKGLLNVARRAAAIVNRYGLSARRMERRLAAFHRILERYGCRPTLPVTAVAVARNPDMFSRFAALGIEFAVHGYYHVDHAELTADAQVEQLGRARRLLEGKGVPPVGFRAPYLRWNDGTLQALRKGGFLYDSSQAMCHPIDPALETEDYRRALAFYRAIPAEERPVVPSLADGLVRIPCCLPDDEALVDRLRVRSPESIARLWLEMFQTTHQREELLTLQVHPERIEACANGVVAVLDAARVARPGVWVAPLKEIARWWRQRTGTAVHARDTGPGRIHVTVRGPEGVTVLARGLTVVAADPWVGGYLRLPGNDVDLRVDRRPFVGIHPSSPAAVGTFLREQGYIVEVSTDAHLYSCFVRTDRFSPEDERLLIRQIEEGGSPLLRLGRWPDGTRSAVSMTGDVDALTIWDYALRAVGR